MAEADHPVLFLLLAAALWLAIGVAMAYVGGWRTLAIHYRARGPFHGRRWHFTSAFIQHVAYHHCLTFGASTRGLYISLWLPFRFSHPPLFVPWSEIDSIERRHESGHSLVKFHFRRTPSVAFEMSRDLAMATIGEAHGRTLPPGADCLLDPGTPTGEAAS